MTEIQIVGIVPVRNEDVFVEQVIRNILGFCDRVHVADNDSTDRTPEILERLAREDARLDVRRVGNIRDTQDLVAPYANTPTWVFGVDGDELYDPEGLIRLRAELLAGGYLDQWHLRSNVLNAVAIDRAGGTATGYLSPPSRPMAKLYNVSLLERWDGPSVQALHGGVRVFRPGFGEELTLNLGERFTWEESPFRCLHCCFVRRSSLDPEDLEDTGRLSPIDIDRIRSSGSRIVNRLRRGRPRDGFGSDWKDDKYRRGELVTRDVSAFFPPATTPGSRLSP